MHLVPQSQIDRLAADGIPDLALAVVAFKQALADHALTVGVPAPVAPDPLIDQIARLSDGEFSIVEDETGLPPDNPESLTAQLAAAKARAEALERALLAAGVITAEEIDAAASGEGA